MFTGLVQAVGAVSAVQVLGAERRIAVELAGLRGPGAGGAFRIGDSIALSGVCCTVVELAAGSATFHLSGETLARTWLGAAEVGRSLNLEAALCAGEPLGGHIVQGHVDGVGEVVAGIDAAAGGELVVQVPRDIQKYCIEKGSITLDGVSLTIAGQPAATVRIAVIPHTAQVTTLGRLRPGDPVHVEADVLAKYVERLLARTGRGN